MAECSVHQSLTVTSTGTSTSSSTLDDEGNNISGAYDSTATSSWASTATTTTTNQGTNSTTTETASGTSTVGQEGNSIAGDYTLDGTFGTTSTAIEETSHGTFAASFTEILTEDASRTETGNAIAGDYSLDETGDRTSSFLSEGDNAGGSFFVTQGTTGTFTATQTGNAVNGDYTRDEASSLDYWFTQEAAGSTVTFTLTGEGTLSDVSLHEVGNSVEGTYNHTKTGTDDYTLLETGSNPGGSFTQTVTGTDTFEEIESGNKEDGTYARTVTGGGSYDRDTTGPGATKPTDSDTTEYTLSETGDSLAGHFATTQTGTTRYDLLEGFNDVSNTTNGATPGHVKFVAYGVPFVDPVVSEWDPRLKENYRNSLITEIHAARSLAAKYSDGRTAVELDRLRGILEHGGTRLSTEQLLQLNQEITALTTPLFDRAYKDAVEEADKESRYRAAAEATRRHHDSVVTIRPTPGTPEAELQNVLALPPGMKAAVGFDMLMAGLSPLAGRAAAHNNRGFNAAEREINQRIDSLYPVTPKHALPPPPGFSTIGGGASAINSQIQVYLSRSGGRLGGTATRQLNHRLATELENRALTVTNGAGRGPEQWIRGPGGGTRGGTWVDITARNGNQWVRIQTVDTLADGVTLTSKEAAAAARIRAAFPNDQLILVSKQTGLVIP